MTLSYRTRKYLASYGIFVANAEVSLPGRLKKDLFGFIDMVALDRDQKRLIGIQVTGGYNGMARVHKIRSSEIWPKAEAWLSCGGEIEVWDWIKKEHGASVRYTPRVTHVRDQHHGIAWGVGYGDRAKGRAEL